MIDTAFAELVPVTSTARACRLLGKSRATHYRRQRPPLRPAPGPRPIPPNALSEAERAAVLAVLTSPRFLDKSVAQTWATLLDEGTYLASMSTMHRALRAAGQAGDRRRQAAHPARKRPELVAHGPGAVWSWDITKLAGPGRGGWFDLYVILDIFSRYVVGWTVAPAESGDLAAALIADAIGRARGARRTARRPGHLHDQQTRRPAVARSRRGPQPFPSARVQRQSLQRSRVQDPQVCAGVPGEVRFGRGRSNILCQILRLL